MSVLEIPGAINFRDIGGLPAVGGVTRFGVLYRSGTLSGLDDAGLRELSALGLRRVIDLRAREEVARAPSPVDAATVRLQSSPLFLGSAASFFEEDVSLRDMYRRVLTNSAPRVVEVVRGILADQPVLVHCTVGKDRTGITVAVALAAVGVDRDAVVDDYARTETLLPAARNEHVLALVRAHHPHSQHAEELATRSPAEVMSDVLAELDRDYGSVAGYLGAHGVDEDELRRLRDALLQS